MPYATSKGCRIYYESHGNGPTIALLHGAGGNHAIWWQQVAHLRAKYRVIPIDLRGFGCSDAVAGGPDAQDFPDDIRAVLQDAGVSEVTLVGQSLGAPAALRCGVQNRELVKGIVLTNSIGSLNHPELNALAKADRARAEKLPIPDRLLTKRFQEQHPDRMFLFQQIGSFNRSKLPDVRNFGIPGPTPEEVNAAAAKVFFIAGEVDSAVSVETVSLAHRLLPGSTLRMVPGTPHSMYWESPEIFNDALERCLGDLYGAR